MVFEWNAHRFSGGLLALDLVNTVVCREDAKRRADRFEDADNIRGFASAAARFRIGELGGAQLAPPSTRAAQAALLGLREAVNDWLRPQVKGHPDSAIALERLFAAAAACTRTECNDDPLPLGRASAVSAMRLFDPAVRARTRICPNCSWLFVDHSKNRSRLWCDMAVCGNRAKAKAHYKRRSVADVASEAEH